MALVRAFLIVASIAAATAAAENATSPPPPPSPLSVLLSDLVFALPTEVFTLQKLDVNVSVHNLTCTALAIGSFSLAPNAAREPETATLNFAGLSVDCRGDFAWEELAAPRKGGGTNFSFSLVNSSLAAKVTVPQSADGLPKGLTAAVTKDRFVAANLRLGEKNLSQPVQQALQDTLDLGLDAAADLLVQALAHPIDTLLARFANNASALLPARPPLPPPPVPAAAVPLLDDGTIQLINLVTNQWLDSALNGLVDAITEPTAGSVSLVLPAGWNKTLVVGGVSLQVSVRRINVTGLDHWRSFLLFEPVSNTSLASSLAFANVSVAVQVEVSANAVHGLPGGLFRESAWVSLALNTASLNASLTLGLNATWADALYLLQYGQPGCVARAVEVLNFTQIVALASGLQVRIVALADGSLEQQLAALLDGAIATGLGAFGPGILGALFAGVFAWPTLDALNNFAAHFLDMHANSTCEPQNRVEPEKTRQVEQLASLLFPCALAVGLLLAALVYKTRQQARVHTLRQASHRYFDPGWAGAGGDDNPKRPLLFAGRGESWRPVKSLDADASLGAATAGWDEGLLFSVKTTASWVAAFVPLLFCINVACLVVAHVNVLAEAKGIITAGNRTIEQVVIEYLTNYRTIAQFYEARVYIFYAVVLTGAVLVPYAQLLAMVVVWGAPLPVALREWLVWLLAASCKLCFIEVMLPVLIPTAVYYVLPLDPSSELLIAIFPAPATFVHMAYCFGSIFLVNLTTWSLQRRQAIFSAQKAEDDSPSRFPENSTPTCRSRQFFGLAALVAVTGLTAFAAWAPFVSFTHHGLAGLALEYANITRTRAFNLPELCFPAYYSPNTWTKGYLAVMFAMAALTPLLLCAALAILCAGHTRLSLATRRFWHRVCDCLCAWACPEILVVSAVSLRLELREFVLFIFGPYCRQINQVLAAHFSVALDGDPRCFDVTTELEHGFYWLLGAALGGIVLRNVLLHSSGAALRAAQPPVVPRFN